MLYNAKKKFNNTIAKFEYSPAFIRKALSKERLGGTCLLNLCAGGETLLSKDVIPIVRQLLEEGHCIMLVTNGTIKKRFLEISKLPESLLKHLIFKFSFHYMELMRLNLLDEYFNNIQLMKSAGASVTVEITPSDELIPYIDEIKQVCMKKLGTLCHITIGRIDENEIPVLSKYTLDEYVEIWDTFNSELLEFKSTIFGRKRTEFCYAGDWILYLNLATGDLKQCYRGLKIQNIYNDINKKIKPFAIARQCPEPHCYNGHAFLTLGAIPEMDTPYYCEMRDRVDTNGKHWLTSDMQEFISQKLVDNNHEYTAGQKAWTSLRNKNILFLKKVKDVFR